MFHLPTYRILERYFLYLNNSFFLSTAKYYAINKTVKEKVSKPLEFLKTFLEFTNKSRAFLDMTWAGALGRIWII